MGKIVKEYEKALRSTHSAFEKDEILKAALLPILRAFDIERVTIDFDDGTTGVEYAKGDVQWDVTGASYKF